MKPGAIIQFKEDAAWLWDIECERNGWIWRVDAVYKMHWPDADVSFYGFLTALASGKELLAAAKRGSYKIIYMPETRR